MLRCRKIRNSEYYGMYGRFDELYEQSQKGNVFTHLFEDIISDNNILLAYRNIKRNSGSHTAGVDNRTIDDINKLSDIELIDLVRKRLSYYRPNPVRRVEIPKPNGKTRPLGIPTILDRIIQQCFLQVLEPICEARFYEHSYGFRPNRSAENAIAMCYRHLQYEHLYYVVDIDIKGFFAQKGKCAITGEELQIDDVHCHHKKPRYLGGTDEYSNLIIVKKDIHRLIHCADTEKVKREIAKYNLDGEKLKKFNKLRLLAEQESI